MLTETLDFHYTWDYNNYQYKPIALRIYALLHIYITYDRSISGAHTERTERDARHVVVYLACVFKAHTN